MFILLGHIKNALSSMKRSRLRSILTSISVGVSVCSLVIISIISDIGIDTVDSALCEMGMDNLVVSGSKSNQNGLTDCDLENIKKVSNVMNAMPLMYKVTSCEMNSSSSDCMAWGVNEDADEVIELEAVYGRLLNKGDIAQGARVCIVDEDLAKKGFGRANAVGKTIYINFSGTLIAYEIVGIVKNGVNMLQSMLGSIIPNFIYIPYTSMQNITGQSYYNEIAVKVSGNSESTANAIKKTLSASKTSSANVSVENLLQQKDRLGGMFETVSSVLSLIAGISLIVSGLSIMTVMTVSVNERTREIGIKKAIGAKNIDILAEFVFEAVLLSLAGGIIGAAVGVIAALIGCMLTDFTAIISIKAIFGAILFSLLTGLIFGAYPAMKAAKLTPVEALRRE